MMVRQIFYLLWVLQHGADCISFSKTPSNPALGTLGKSVLLPWEYPSNAEMSSITWRRTEEDNTAIATIMILSSNQPVNIYSAYRNRVTYNGSARIIFHDLKLSDEGLISCTVDFSNGSTLYHKTLLQVGTAPHFTTVPSQSFVSEKENVSIECTSIAKPQPAINWYDKNNTMLSTSTKYVLVSGIVKTIDEEIQIKSTLTIIDAGIEDAGKYKCKSFNDISADEADTTLTVYYKPINTMITLQFASRLEGESNDIRCSADAEPSIIYYEIYRGDSLLSNSTSGIASIISVKNYHEGMYRCLPRNWVGVGTEAQDDMIVNVAPVLFDTNLDVITVKEKDGVLITCKFFGDPKPVVIWKKYNGGNDDHIHEVTKTSFSNSTLFQVESDVRIDQTKKSDYGDYSCQAKNDYGTVVKNISLVVQYPPTIVRHTLPHLKFSINESGSDTVDCVSRGWPKPIMKWYRDVAEISNIKHTIFTSVEETGANYVEVRSVLELKSVTKHDAGVIRCEASNAAGSASHNTTLNVYYKPEITAQMDEKTYVNLQTGLTLSCVSKSIEQSVFKWYKNNQQIISGQDNSQIVEQKLPLQPYVSSFLTVNPVTSGDSNSVFKCTATNSQGADSRSTLVSVYFGPVINSFPGPSIITSEFKWNYQISCVIQANPKPTITWLKENQPISDSLNYKLIEVVVTATPELTIMNSTLIIKEVQRTDFGNWTCRGSNTIVGGQFSQTERLTQLTVTYDPRFEFISPNPFRVNHTDTVIFICRVKASPKPFVWWVVPSTILKDNRLTYSTSTIVDKTEFGSVEAKLTITNIGKRDYGDFFCRTNNTLTSTTRLSKLIVQYKPGVKVHFTENNYVVSENSISKMEITVDSNPEAKIEWFKGNGTAFKKITKNIQLQTVVVIKDFEHKYISRLRFPGGVKRTDQGWYLIRTKNLLGEVEKRTYLNVQWKPQAETKLGETQEVTYNESPSVQCRFLSNPNTSIVWYKDGAFIANKQYDTTPLHTNVSLTLTQSTLTFIKAGRNDRANYTCKAKNLLGTAEQWRYLNVLYPPVLEVASKNMLIDLNKPVTFSCQSDANPAVTTYLWKKNNVTLNYNFDRYNILKANKNTAGNYSCTPANKLGNGSTVTYAVTIRIPPTFTQPATCNRVKVTNGGTDYFSCTCQGTGFPQPEIYWTRYPTNHHLSNTSVLNFTVIAANDGTYYCHLKNSKSEITSSVQITTFVRAVGEWTLWGTCNVTCGNGQQSRTRSCNVPPCTDTLKQLSNCVGSCSDAQNKDEENTWLYALYALVPCAVLLLILAIIWIARWKRGNVEHQT